VAEGTLHVAEHIFVYRLIKPVPARAHRGDRPAQDPRSDL
jgi:hypothetical protein